MADNSTSAPALSFQSTRFDVIFRDGQPWLSAADIARALGYGRADAISRIHQRNRAEFTDAMALTVNLTVKGFPVPKPTTIFSLRGAHLLGMFARTPKAAEFRRWVLDVLEQQEKQAVLPAVQPNPLLDHVRATEIAHHCAIRVRRSVYRAALAGADLPKRRLLIEIDPDDSGEPVVSVRHLGADVQVATWQGLAQLLRDHTHMMPLALAQDLAQAAGRQAFRMAAVSQRGRGAELAEQLRREKLPLADLHELLVAAMGEQSCRLQELANPSVPALKSPSSP